MNYLKTPLFVLSFVLLFKALLMLYLDVFAGIDLAPDEAQYWTWSRALDWGYYSKPPAIAWDIYLGTALWGDTLLGVRFGALVIGTLLPFSVYALARSATLSSWIALWAALITALSPMGFFASFYATTDAGYALFWTIACALFVYALSHDQKPNYYLIGIIIGLGALFKWPIYLIWVFFLVAISFFPRQRSQKILGGILLSLFGLLPPFIWNRNHGWPTFQHVWSTMTGGSGPNSSENLFKGNFWDFFAAQVGLLSPLLFFVLLIGLVYFVFYFKEMPIPIIFCAAVTFILLLTYQTAALFQKIQGNWCIFAYPTGIVYLVWFCTEKMKKRKAILLSGLVISILLNALVFSLPAIQANSLAGGWKIPFRYNRLKECLGWDCIPSALQSAGYDPSHHFLFANTYQMSSLLSFYSPAKKRAYFFNLSGLRRNQFSYWPGMEMEQVGRSGFFTSLEVFPRKDGKIPQELIAKKKQKLLPYFQAVKFVGMFPLFYVYGEESKILYVYFCKTYNGKLPPESHAY